MQGSQIGADCWRAVRVVLGAVGAEAAALPSLVDADHVISQVLEAGGHAVHAVALRHQRVDGLPDGGLVEVLVEGVPAAPRLPPRAPRVSSASSGQRGRGRGSLSARPESRRASGNRRAGWGVGVGLHAGAAGPGHCPVPRRRGGARRCGGARARCPPPRCRCPASPALETREFPPRSAPSLAAPHGRGSQDCCQTWLS